MTISEKHRKTITQACRQIESAESPPSLTALAQQANLSKFHFQRLFKSVIGITPKEYAAAHRTQNVQRHLINGKSVTAAMHDAGYGSSGNFYASSSRALGMTPKNFRKGGSNEVIHFAVGQTTIGAILVATTDKGICAIALDNDPNKLVKNLQDQFPNAELIGGDKKFEKTVAHIVGFVENPHIGLDLPLDIRGTAFQQRVWKALQKIPPGKTVTYTEIAQKIGSPSAVRAVASACAANTLAVAIPCHRVIRTDGSLSGYRWGIARKKILLKREQSN